MLLPRRRRLLRQQRRLLLQLLPLLELLLQVLLLRRSQAQRQRASGHDRPHTGLKRSLARPRCTCRCLRRLAGRSRGAMLPHRQRILPERLLRRLVCRPRLYWPGVQSLNSCGRPQGPFSTESCGQELARFRYVDGLLGS